MQEGMYGHSCVFDMLILIEMFSALVGVVQNSCKGPLLAGGMSVIGGRDATGAGVIPVGDQHVEEKGW
jgi:hypothetical protein